MKKLILILAIISFASNSFANQTVMLVSPLVQFEQKDFPLELSKSYQSFSNYYLETLPKEKNSENLLNEFENAQKYYLVGSFELARQYYENVVAFSDMDEWKDVQRKIIFLSYLRLSELNPQNSKNWILQALSFSLEMNFSDLGLSSETIKKINEAKKPFLKESISWQVSPFKKDFNCILINGQVIDLKKIETVKIPSGKFRLTFLSNVYKPQTYQVSSQQIPLLIPTRIPFVSGSCEKPFVNNEGEILSDLATYYSKDCIKIQTGKKWVAIKDSSNATSELSPSYEPRNTGFTTTQMDEDPIYKKTWFLVALGVLGTAAAIYAIDRNEKKPTHETVNGF